MIGWLVASGYLVSAAVFARQFALDDLNGMERQHPTVPISTEDRALSAFFGAMKASVWPATLLVTGVYRLLFAGLRTDGELLAERERRVAEREWQLVEARRQAHELGLAWPDVVGKTTEGERRG